VSGQVGAVDSPSATAESGHPNAPFVEVTDSRDARVGEAHVRRALPRKGRRTVGAWCFADHMGPADVTENSGLDVGPHPHMGLQTVTWLIDGEALHLDSLGSEQVIKPGQLNLMTAGGAISHAEEATGHYRGTLQGIQLWVALPEETRHGAGAFEHHAELPQSELDGAVATVLVGDYGDLSSSARHDGPSATRMGVRRRRP
jgi:redox-sensitive bicupin YhaK (pirin superfamily)